MEAMAGPHSVTKVAAEQEAGATAAEVREPLHCQGGTEAGEQSYYRASLQNSPMMAKLEKVALLTTALFLVWRAVDSDNNDSESIMDSSPVFIAAQHIFLVFFLAEAGVRFFALERKGSIIKCPALAFDLILAVVLAIETWASPNFAVIWVLQLGRFFRLIIVAPEMRIIMMGLYAAMRSVFYCVLLNTMNIYLFAMAFRKFTTGMVVGTKYFDTVPNAMFSLLSHGVFIDGVTVMFHELKHEAGGLIFVFLFFLLITFTLLALTAGVVCQVVSQVATIEKDRLMAHYMANVLRRALGSESAIAMCLTSKESLLHILTEPGAELSMLMRHMQINISDLVTSADILFAGKSYSSLEELAQELLQFDVSRPVTQRNLFRMERRLRMRSGQ